MFSWLTDLNNLSGGLELVLIQVIAALPWLRALSPRGFDKVWKDPASFGTVALQVGLASLAAAAVLGYKSESANMALYGRVYGAVLHLQLLIDLFLLAPQALILVWPKGGAVALAAYRESWRQPMFWLITGFAFLMTWVWVILPYFTFGDDFKMMKQLGFDTVMLAAVLFGVLAASISVSEEIEGRTAITLMSKPINRRQFLLGKFLGILMACGGMSLILELNLNAALIIQPEFDPINKDRSFDPMPDKAKQNLVPVFEACVPPGPAKAVANGAGQWFGEIFAHGFGILLGFGQVMILVSVAIALATRLPFIMNLVLCLVLYFLGHLAPVVVKVTGKAGDGAGAGTRLVRFLGDLFDTILPALEFFNMGPAIIRETPLDLWSFAVYSLTVFGYAALYTTIALLVGLVMFEDRDLA